MSALWQSWSLEIQSSDVVVVWRGGDLNHRGERTSQLTPAPWSARLTFSMRVHSDAMNNIFIRATVSVWVNRPKPAIRCNADNRPVCYWHRGTIAVSFASGELRIFASGDLLRVHSWQPCLLWPLPGNHGS